jgi:broad specificity phosphatase PhoE
MTPPSLDSRLTLYFVRHGESEANVLKQFSNGLGKHPLTERGRQQAVALAHRLRGASITRVYCSPVLRAHQTAEVLSAELSADLKIEDALREFDVGVLEGKSDQASWDAYWDLVEAWVKRHDWGRRIEGGESFVDIRNRFLPFIRSLVQQPLQISGGVVLVGHGGTYRCMLPLLFENVSFEFAAEHGLTETGYVVGKPGSHGLVCLSWGETQLRP